MDEDAGDSSANISRPEPRPRTARYAGAIGMRLPAECRRLFERARIGSWGDSAVFVRPDHALKLVGAVSRRTTNDVMVWDGR